MPGILASINVSRGGVPKLPIAEVRVTVNGLDGDYQRDQKHHGGPNRAVVLYSLEVIRALHAEGHPIGIGAAGENLTLSGVDWARIEPGQEVQIGTVRLGITKYANPCETIRRAFVGGEFSRISQKLHPGWSRLCARVLQEGLVRVGDPVVRLKPDATIVSDDDRQ
jgi:MOSC domain-containing protein YiiM